MVELKNRVKIFLCLKKMDLIKSLFKIQEKNRIDILGLSTVYFDANKMDMNRYDCLVICVDFTCRIEEFLLALLESGYKSKIIVITKMSIKDFINDMKIRRIHKLLLNFKVVDFISLVDGKESFEVKIARAIQDIEEEHCSLYSHYIRKRVEISGIPVKLDGYKYICTAIEIILDDVNKWNNKAMTLYRKVASIHGTTSSRVEKSMRTALEHVNITKNTSDKNELRCKNYLINISNDIKTSWETINE